MFNICLGQYTMSCFLSLPHAYKVSVIFKLLFFAYISFDVYIMMMIMELKSILTLNMNFWKYGMELTMMQWFHFARS